MSDTVENLILDLVEWVGRKGRSYQETMEAWRTSCPRLPVWEDANERGLVEMAWADGRSIVRATAAGLDCLKRQRPRAHEALQQDATARRRIRRKGRPVALADPGHLGGVDRDLAGGGRALQVEQGPGLGALGGLGVAGDHVAVEVRGDFRPWPRCRCEARR
jgi:hypothetical protein